MSKAEKEKNAFMDLHADLTYINPASNSLLLTDLKGDGEFKFVFYDQQLQAIVSYKGINRQHQKESKIPNIVGMLYFYEKKSSLNQPAIGVISESNFYIYRSMKQSYRFKLPNVQCDKRQKQIWKQQDYKTIKQKLNQLNKEIQISYAASSFLSLEKQSDLKAVKEEIQKNVFFQKDYISCGCVITQSLQPYASGNVVLGTQKRKLFILQSNGHSFKKAMDLNYVAQFMLFNQKELIIGGRNKEITFFNKIFQKQIQQTFEVEQKIVSMCYVEPFIYIALLNKKVIGYQKPNIKQFTIALNSNILLLQSMVTINKKACLIALSNKEIRVYKENQLMCTLHLDYQIKDIKTGTFGRQEGCLIIIYKNHGFQVKALKRNFNVQKAWDLNNYTKNKLNQIKESGYLLPKKSKEFIQYIEYERDNSKEMAQIFKKNFLKMKIQLLKSKLRYIDQEGSMGMVRISGVILGLGPYFKIIISIENQMNQPLKNLILVAYYDSKIFQVENSVNEIQFLPSRLQFKVVLSVMNIDSEGKTDQIKVYLFESKRNNPICSALIQMPLSQLKI